jgi:hypothetical protein
MVLNMSEEETFWITDKDISEEIFEGLPVPADQTITKGRNLSFKRTSTSLIQALFKLTPPEDTYNLLRTYSITIYKRLMEDDTEIPIDSEKDRFILDLISRTFKRPPIAGIGANGEIH